MDNEIYDNNFHRLGYLEQIEYLSYTDKLYECGSFQITCPVTEINMDLLKTDRVVFFEHDVAGVIQSIQYSQDSDQDIEVYGNLLDVFLDWRYIHPTIDLYNVTPVTFMQEVVRRNFITCSAKRVFPSFEIKNNSSTMGGLISKQQTGGSVMEFLMELGAAYGIGFRVGMDRRRKKFVFETITGRDMTIDNAVGNKKLLFSDDLNNILSCNYAKDDEPYRNTALVAGERGDESREELLVISTPTEQSGWSRRELYVDARDLQSTKEVKVPGDDGEEKTENVEMSREEYAAILKTRGDEKLGECASVEAFEAEVNNATGTQFVYRQDYTLGDRVTAIKKDLGIVINAQITEIQITYDKSGYNVIPTIGNPQLTLYSRLKRRGV